jgi:hypothetical protein
MRFGAGERCDGRAWSTRRFVELGGQIGLEVVAPWLTIGTGGAPTAGGPR